MGMILDTVDSPLGQITLCSDGKHITAVVFAGQKYEALHIGNAAKGTCPVIEQGKVWLSQYFNGEKPEKLPPLAPKGTPFQQKVWGALLDIPYGKTLTYGDLAKKLDCKSPQAVGGAVGRNPISILIPCHRVVGVDGKLTGYAGGLDKKAALLKLECIIE